MATFKSLFILISSSLLTIAVIFASCQNTTLSPIDACYQEALVNDSVLEACSNDFSDLVTNVVPSVVAFCNSGCSRCVAQNYYQCRNAGEQTRETTRFGTLSTAVFGEVIQTACTVDPKRENKFCGDLIDFDLNPDYSRSLSYANGNCSGEVDCSKPECKDAIEALGCCAGLAHLYGTMPDVTQETFDDCNVAECRPVPFDLSPFQPCSAGSLVPPVITLSAVVVILAVGQLF